jgi:hypothetical protein
VAIGVRQLLLMRILVNATASWRDFLRRIAGDE